MNGRIYPTVGAFYGYPLVDMHNRMKEAPVMLGKLDRAVVRAPLMKLSADELQRTRKALVEARRIDEGRAKQMIYLGEPISAQTALDWGLINCIAPIGTGAAFTRTLALNLAQRPVNSIALAEQSIDDSFHYADAETIPRLLETSGGVSASKRHRGDDGLRREAASAVRQALIAAGDGLRNCSAQRRSGSQLQGFRVGSRLEGKRIVVTGAANGIGASVARRCTEEGARVIAVDLNVTQLEAIRAASRRQVDISDAQAVDRLASEFERIDVLFNSAGYVAVGDIFQTSDADWEKSFGVNVRGTHLMMRAFLPGMLEQGHGVITNAASIGGTVSAVADRYVYGATKGAVIGLTKSVAVDFVDRNIRANCICPGTILTPSMKARIENVASRDGREISVVMREYAGRQVMRRMADPDEIAAVAIYLCSDESSFCTGGCYVIDGGNSM